MAAFNRPDLAFILAWSAQDHKKSAPPVLPDHQKKRGDDDSDLVSLLLLFSHSNDDFEHLIRLGRSPRTRELTKTLLKFIQIYSAFYAKKIAKIA